MTDQEIAQAARWLVAWEQKRIQSIHVLHANLSRPAVETMRKVWDKRNAAMDRLRKACERR